METQRPLRVGMILVVAAMVATSCGTQQAVPSSAEPGSDQPATPGASAEDARYGGTLTQWLRGESGSLDPDQATAGDLHNIVDVAYNTLIARDPQDENEVVPDLAASWEISDDGLVYTFDLVDGVTWHDGEPFTADDVKFTLERLIDPPGEVMSPHQPVLQVIETIETPDALTVELTLSRPSNLLFSVLSLTSVSILPQHLFESEGPDALNDAILGTGPFRVVEFTRGVEYIFEKNEDYFKEGLPYLDGVEMTIVEDRATALQAFIAGNFDLGDALLPPEAEELRAQRPDFTITELESFNYAHLIFNTHEPPFDDPRVREAFSLAIDRDAAIQIAGDGVGSVGGPIPKSAPFSLPEEELEEFAEFDPSLTIEERRARARELLAEAGYADGLEVRWVHREDGAHLAWGQFVRDQLEQIGVTAINEPLERVAAFDSLLAGEGNFYSWHLTYRVQDPTDQIAQCCIPGGNWNVFDYDNPEVTQLWEEQDATSDPGEREELVHEIQRLLLADRPRAWAYWWVEFRVVSPRVMDFAVQHDLLAGGRHETIWLQDE